MNKEIKKHPDTIAWEKWKETDEAKKCLEGKTWGVYLENRLMRAFMAGRENEQISEK